jgi:hypothetical protein
LAKFFAPNPQDAMGTNLLFSRRMWTASGCAALVLSGAMGLVCSLPGYRPRDFLLRRLEAGLALLPETEVLPQARQMAELGEAGTAAVVRLLGSPRDCELEAAQVVLAEQLNQWRLLPVTESAPRAIALARDIAAQRDKLTDEGRRFAGEVATQLLLWPASDASQAEELLTHCERILSAAGPKDRRAAATPAPAVAVDRMAGPPLSSFPRRTVP